MGGWPLGLACAASCVAGPRRHVECNLGVPWSAGGLRTPPFDPNVRQLQLPWEPPCERGCTAPAVAGCTSPLDTLTLT